ncbi:MAG: hypothetical protein AABW75_04600 [Nanoarchaeota archaeon]
MDEQIKWLEVKKRNNIRTQHKNFYFVICPNLIIKSQKPKVFAICFLKENLSCFFHRVGVWQLRDLNFSRRKNFVEKRLPKLSCNFA